MTWRHILPLHSVNSLPHGLLQTWWNPVMWDGRRGVGGGDRKAFATALELMALNPKEIQRISGWNTKIKNPFECKVIENDYLCSQKIN